MLNHLQLHQISLRNDEGPFTVFIALSAREHAEFKRQPRKDLSKFPGRVVHTVKGETVSESDRRDAKNAFGHRFGQKKNQSYQVG